MVILVKLQILTLEEYQVSKSIGVELYPLGTYNFDLYYASPWIFLKVKVFRHFFDIIGLNLSKLDQTCSNLSRGIKLVQIRSNFAKLDQAFPFF